MKDKIYLDDSEVFEIAGTNIAAILGEYMNKMCFNCDKIVYNELSTLECTCQLCKDCLNKYLMQATNGEMILNKFEKSKYIKF